MSQCSACCTTPCDCATCRPYVFGDARFIVCETCGNKRCPHATNHRHACTRSNVSGQSTAAAPELGAAIERLNREVPLLAGQGWAVAGGMLKGEWRAPRAGDQCTIVVGRRDDGVWFWTLDGHDPCPVDGDEVTAALAAVAWVNDWSRAKDAEPEPLQSVADRLNREVPLPGGARWRVGRGAPGSAVGHHGTFALFANENAPGIPVPFCTVIDESPENDDDGACCGGSDVVEAARAAVAWVEGQRTIRESRTVGAPEATPPANTIDHPAHYGGPADPYEAIRVIEAWGLGFHLGNVVKYVSRAERKGAPVDDLKKARWYLDREIARREEKANA